MVLVGRAGAGKTHRVVEELRRHLCQPDAAGRFERFQLLVPTYSQAEHVKRRLLRGPAGVAALLDRGVGTFEQLAERETGVRLHALAPAAVRDALLAQALADDDFPEFRAVSRFPGFRRAALRFVKEVKASDPGEDDPRLEHAAERLVAAAAELPGARGRKLLGLARGLRAYQARLVEARLLDHEDLLRALLARLRAHPPERLRWFALDGFTDLTEVQERIVQALAAHADASLVTLVGDPSGRRDGPFEASAGLLGRLCAGSGFTLERLPDVRRGVGDLVRVERRAAGDELAPEPPDGSVRFLAGADPSDEADRVARTCLRFLAEGVPHGDVLVVVRRMDGETADRVLDALRRHGVPHRRAGRAPLATSPAARSALRALRLVAGAGEPGDVLAALCGGDARDVADAEADALRVAVRPLGSVTAEALAERAEALALPAAATWLRALVALRIDAAPRAPSEIARDLLVALPRLLRWSFEGAVPAESAARAADDAAALRRVRAVVAETVAALGSVGVAATTPAEFVAAVDAAAGDATFGARDGRVDVVNVVDADEARQWEARAVVVAGLRMGEFPGGAREDPFLADGDRAAVEHGARLRLPARLDDALRRERLLFYAAVTRATERLVLTRPLADAGGDPVAPSPFLEDLLEMWPPAARVPDGAERTPGEPQPAPGETFTDADLVAASLAALGERFVPGGAAELRAHTGLALAQELATHPRRAALLRRAARARTPRAARLHEGGAAALLLARPRRRSASSLASFVQCAYRHFAERGLGLREPDPAPEDGLDALTAGQVLHAALERAVKARARTAEQADAAFAAAWHEHAGHLLPGLSLARERAALRHAVLEQVLAEAEAPLVPGYAPAHVEWPFGLEGAAPLVVASGGATVEVAGKVDRIDTDAGGHAVVVDYKWSRITRFAALARRIAEGEDVQLPLYVLAVERGLGVRVGAAGYLTLRDGRRRWLRLTAEAPRGSGDVDWTADAGAAALRDVEAFVVRVDADVRSARIDVRPRDEDQCAWCPFGDVCRVDEVAP